MPLMRMAGNSNKQMQLTVMKEGLDVLRSLSRHAAPLRIVTILGAARKVRDSPTVDSLRRVQHRACVANRISIPLNHIR
jgi:hypothetical protein